MSCPDTSRKEGQQFSTDHPPRAHTSPGNMTDSSPSLPKNASWRSSPHGDAGLPVLFPNTTGSGAPAGNRAEHTTSISTTLKLLSGKNVARMLGSALPSSEPPGWAQDLFACWAACSLMTICPAVPTPLWRVGGRLLNQALTSEHHTQLMLLCLYPCTSVAGGCCRSPGPSRGHLAVCVMRRMLWRKGSSGVCARPVGMDAAQR